MDDFPYTTARCKRLLRSHHMDEKALSDNASYGEQRIPRFTSKHQSWCETSGITAGAEVNLQTYPIDDRLTPHRELWKIGMKHPWRGRSMPVGLRRGTRERDIEKEKRRAKQEKKMDGGKKKTNKGRMRNEWKERDDEMEVVMCDLARSNTMWKTCELLHEAHSKFPAHLLLHEIVSSREVLAPLLIACALCNESNLFVEIAARSWIKKKRIASFRGEVKGIEKDRLFSTISNPLPRFHPSVPVVDHGAMHHLYVLLSNADYHSYVQQSNRTLGLNIYLFIYVYNSVIGSTCSRDNEKNKVFPLKLIDIKINVLSDLQDLIIRNRDLKFRIYDLALSIESKALEPEIF
ncbi:hypothetical protein APICC_05839 [Apis cerana cerana]|uniref:Uncharacterized protein n=1 Tax=Apis cerana cerana TaxID=94128 RepID=A0A2A3EU69_APICC|nr:hypothetical protein APICC_05839 [Apis cerana cerana]